MRTLTKKYYSTIIAIIMATILLAVAFTGCTSDKSSTSGEEKDTTKVETKKEETAKEETAEDTNVISTMGEDGEWQPSSDYSERVSLTYANVMVTEGFDYTAGDGLTKFYSDKFNYDLEVTGLSWGSWKETVRVWVNSGDMPDFVCFNFKYPDAAAFVEQELVKEMPENWKTRWPNLASAVDVTSVGPAMEENFGGTFFLPRPRFKYNLPGNPVPNHYSIHYRKDWVEAVGGKLDTLYTTTEVLDLARLIKEQDPGNIGDSLIPLAVGPDTAVRFFVYRNSTHYNNYYKDENGMYQWGPASEDTLKGLKLFKQAYDEGLIDPDFYTQTTDEEKEQFQVQGAAALAYSSLPTSHLTDTYNIFEDNIGLNGWDTVGYASALGDDGYYHQQDLINYWASWIFNPEIEDVKFERIMDILDWNGTAEGSATMNLGIQGEDWEYNDDGSFKSLLPEGSVLGGTDGKYPSWGYVLGATILFDDFGFDDPNYEKRVRDLSFQLYSERCETTTPETMTETNWDMYKYDSPAMRQTQFNFNDEYSGLILLPGDIEENWKAWVAEKLIVVQPILDELNENLG